MACALRMTSGTSSQSNFQSSKRGRKSASLPGRFQSSRGSMASVAHVQIADPVDQRLALLGVGAADGIADEFLVVMARLHHGGAAEERLAHGDAAPHQDALPLGRALVGIEMRAHGGVDAVGADQDIGRGLLDDLPSRSTKRAVTLPPFCSKSAMRRPNLIRSAPSICLARVEQDHLQLAAMDGELRPRQAGMAAARIGPDRLAVAVGVAQLAAFRWRCRPAPVRDRGPRGCGRRPPGC